MVRLVRLQLRTRVDGEYLVRGKFLKGQLVLLYKPIQDLHQACLLEMRSEEVHRFRIASDEAVNFQIRRFVDNSEGFSGGCSAKCEDQYLLSTFMEIAPRCLDVYQLIQKITLLFYKRALQIAPIIDNTLASGENVCLEIGSYLPKCSMSVWVVRQDGGS